MAIAAVSWDFAGRVAIRKAKEDLRRAGFEFVLPAAKPKLPDEDNAAFWFIRAGESESLKSFDEKFYKKIIQVVTLSGCCSSIRWIRNDS